MVTPAKRPATYADLRRLPEDQPAEIIAGEIVALPPAPLPRHSNAQGATRRFIGGPFHDDHGHGGPGGWWIFAEIDIALSPRDFVRPDLSGWRRERLSAPEATQPIAIAPDWVCEVISRSTASRDRVTKRALYARSGVGFYWLIDPQARVLEALDLRDGMWVERAVYDDGATARVPPFEEVELAVGRLFLPRQAGAEDAGDD
jgi:Uma2 family endonuclease